MALQQTVTANFGMVIEDAYLRVEDVSIITNPVSYAPPGSDITTVPVRNSLIRYVFKSYINKDTTTPFNIETISNYYVLSSDDNPIKQAYNYLKTLPAYENAVDV